MLGAFRAQNLMYFDKSWKILYDLLQRFFVCWICYSIDLPLVWQKTKNLKKKCSSVCFVPGAQCSQCSVTPFTGSSCIPAQTLLVVGTLGGSSAGNQRPHIYHLWLLNTFTLNLGRSDSQLKYESLSSSCALKCLLDELKLAHSNKTSSNLFSRPKSVSLRREVPG